MEIINHSVEITNSIRGEFDKKREKLRQSYVAELAEFREQKEEMAASIIENEKFTLEKEKDRLKKQYDSSLSLAEEHTFLEAKKNLSDRVMEELLTILDKDKKMGTKIVTRLLARVKEHYPQAKDFHIPKQVKKAGCKSTLSDWRVQGKLGKSEEVEATIQDLFDEHAPKISELLDKEVHKKTKI